MLLIGVEHTSEETETWIYSSTEIELLIHFCSVVQLLLAISVYLSYLTQYYPIIIHRNVHTHKPLTLNDQMTNRITSSVLLKRIILHSKREVMRDRPFLLKSDFFIVMADRESCYKFVYLLCSMIALASHLFYPFLLLDIISKIKAIQSLLRPIARNWYTLLITGAFGLILIYIFSFLGLILFADDFIDENTEVNTYCSSLSNCFLSSIKGIAAPGGIGTWLSQPIKSASSYFPRVIYDLSYFSLISIILIGLITAIIVGTFITIRNENKQKGNVLNRTCSICGVYMPPDSTFHSQRHNLHSYIALIIHIESKATEDCNELEEYIKECLKEKTYKFFPINK